MELNSHADTIDCGSNCIVMRFTGKECDVAPYTDAYETIKSVPIVQANTAYDNPETWETTILILNEAIWMGATTDHTLVNPNQLREYGMTFQDNPFAEAPVFVATEDHAFMLLLYSKKTLYLDSPQESPQSKRYRRAHMLPVCWRMSGIHRMFVSPRACVLWNRIYQGTLA